MRNPFRRRHHGRTPTIQINSRIINLDDGFPAELLGAWDQQAAGVRDIADAFVDTVANVLDCQCGASPDGPERTIRLHANLLANLGPMELAALVTEFAIRAAHAKNGTPK